jgi:hypothetical protein
MTSRIHTMRDILNKIDSILVETALNPANAKGDYQAKKKALYDLETDPAVIKEPELMKAVTQRKLDLEKEAKSIGIKESAEPDHEADMAKAELAQIAKNAITIYKLIHSGQNLDGWISSYITLANDHLNSVAEKLEHDEGKV